MTREVFRVLLSLKQRGGEGVLEGEGKDQFSEDSGCRTLQNMAVWRGNCSCLDLGVLGEVGR